MAAPVKESRATALAGAEAMATTARYVRLEALSEVNGNPWTSVAEFNLLDASGTTMPRAGWKVDVDSEELVGEIAPGNRALDGDGNSLWHTQWQGANPPLPHALTVDLGTARQISGFRYLPRQVGMNGRIAAWRLHTSVDGTRWTVASQGTFANTSAEATVMLSGATALNQQPVLAALADRTDTAGQSLSQAVRATDADGDTLAYSATGLPPGVAIDASTGIISGTASATGVYSVALRVTDGQGGVATGGFGWTIAGAPTSSGSAVSSRQVRLVVLSEVNGNPWASMAEFNLLDAAGGVMPRTGWTVSADSQELSGENAPASHVLDGDPYSFWHTRWQGTSPAMPHTLTIDLASLRSIGGFKVLPRQGGSNGRIARWRFESSVDGASWTQAASGTFTDTAAEQTVMLSATAAAPSTPADPTPMAAGPTRTARIAAFASGPLVAAIAWRAGEAVTTDAVRRLGSGHHLFYSVAGTTGTVEPVVGGGAVDGRPIADGTATAYLNGRVLGASAANAPTFRAVADARSAGLSPTAFAAGDFTAPRWSTVQGCRSISTGTSFIGHYCFANGLAAGSGNATAIASGPYGAGLSPSYSYHANSWEEEFVVTDTAFGLVFANSATPIDVEIDGVPVQAGPTLSSGSEGWTLVFDFAGVSKRRVVRVVSAVGSVAPTLRGVALTAQGRVEASSTANDQVLFLGDSINAAVVPTSEAGAQMLSYWVQRDLGFGGAINMAVGGSGYVSQNSNTFNIPNLLANPVNQSLIAGYAPNVTHVIVGAGFNDRTRPLATVQAAALASWKAIRVQLPNVKITITDGWSGSSGPDADALALAAGLADTFAAWGDRNARLVHSIGTSAATAYVNGTGHAGLPIAAGNSSVYTSVDAVHPSPAGARYLARRLSDDIVSAWAGAY